MKQDVVKKPEPTRARRFNFGALSGVSSLWILAALLLIYIVFAALKPGAFLTSFNFTNIAINTAILLIMAVGQTYVISTGGIDLSVGSVLVMSSVVAALVTKSLVDSQGATASAIAIGGALGILTGVLWGVINGLLVAFAHIPPLIVTLGTMGMALGFAQIITGGNDVHGMPSLLISSVGQGRLGGVLPYMVLIAVVIAVLGAIFLNQTKFGRYTLAIGSDKEAARRNGISVSRHLVKVYALSGALAGLSGWLALARFGSTTIGGFSTVNLDTIAAVVLGGTSLFGGVATILGTVIGALIPTTLQNGFTILGIEPFWQSVAVGAVLIAAVYYDQHQRKRRSQR